MFSLLYNITFSELLKIKSEKNFEKNEIKVLTSEKPKCIMELESKKGEENGKYTKSFTTISKQDPKTII